METSQEFQEGSPHTFAYITTRGHEHLDVTDAGTSFREQKEAAQDHSAGRWLSWMWCGALTTADGRQLGQESLISGWILETVEDD